MITTTDLNEAAYLYTLGIVPERVQRTAQVQAIFYYKNTRNIKDWLTHYRTGMAEACITHFVYSRTVLKGIVSTQPVEKLCPEAPVVGEGYWYIVNKTILHALYGKDVVHYNRWNDGNYYKTKQEAQAALGI